MSFQLCVKQYTLYIYPSAHKQLRRHIPNTFCELPCINISLEPAVTGQYSLETPVTGQYFDEPLVTSQYSFEPPVTGQYSLEPPVTGQYSLEPPVTGHLEPPVTGQYSAGTFLEGQGLFLCGGKTDDNRVIPQCYNKQCK